MGLGLLGNRIRCLGSWGRNLKTREPTWEQNGLTPMFNIMQIALAKCWSARGVSHEPAFMDSCPTITSHCVCPVYLVHRCKSLYSMVLVLWGVGDILGNEYRIPGKNCFIVQGSEMSTGFHSGNLILGICFRLITLNVYQWSQGFPYCGGWG